MSVRAIVVLVTCSAVLSQAQETAPPPRTFRVLVAADASFRKFYFSPENPAVPDFAIGYAMERLSDIFTHDLGIAFHLSGIATLSTGYADDVDLSACDVLLAARREFPPSKLDELNADIVLALSMPPKTEGRPFMSDACKPEAESARKVRERTVGVGQADSFSRYVSSKVISDQNLAHEFGHLFGALHVADPHSYMCFSGTSDCDADEWGTPLSEREVGFDAVNRERILFLRNEIDLRVGVMSISDPSRRRYSATVRGESAMFNPIASALRDFGFEVLFDQKDYLKAADFLKEAMQLQPSDCLSRVLYGVTQSALSNFGQARRHFEIVLASRSPDHQGCRDMAEKELKGLPAASAVP